MGWMDPSLLRPVRFLSVLQVKTGLGEAGVGQACRTGQHGTNPFVRLRPALSCLGHHVMDQDSPADTSV